MKYTLKVELEVEIEFLNIDELDEDAKEEIEDIVVETLSDNSYEITKNIFDWLYRRTWTPKTETLGHFGREYF